LQFNVRLAVKEIPDAQIAAVLGELVMFADVIKSRPSSPDGQCIL
jgi:hypothetical protein